MEPIVTAKAVPHIRPVEILCEQYLSFIRNVTLHRIKLIWVSNSVSSTYELEALEGLAEHAGDSFERCCFVAVLSYAVRLILKI